MSTIIGLIQEGFLCFVFKPTYVKIPPRLRQQFNKVPPDLSKRAQHNKQKVSNSNDKAAALFQETQEYLSRGDQSRSKHPCAWLGG